jgi:hypothetical protein
VGVTYIATPQPPPPFPFAPRRASCAAVPAASSVWGMIRKGLWSPRGGGPGGGGGGGGIGGVVDPLGLVEAGCSPAAGCDADALLLTEATTQGRVDQLPSWFVPSPYVHSGYRLGHHTVAACLRSVLALHNDTLNIWSHLVAFLAWLWLAVGVMGGPAFAAAPPGVKWVGVGALLAGSLMPLASAVAHTVHPVSAVWYVWAWRLDYAGILVGWGARYLFVAWALFSCDSYYGFVRPWLVAGGGAAFAAAAGPVVLRRNMVGTPRLQPPVLPLVAHATAPPARVQARARVHLLGVHAAVCMRATRLRLPHAGSRAPPPGHARRNRHTTPTCPSLHPLALAALRPV